MLSIISSPFLYFFAQFGELEGFTAIQTKLNTEEIEIAVRPLFSTSVSQ